jgi:hypothetical protein
MKITDFVQFTDKFQTSVNIDYDLLKSEKLRDYIPTSDVCDVLESYFTGILKNENHATFLIGPYGKGKSFLVLSLLQIVCGISGENETKAFAKRVGLVDPKLEDSILSIRSSKTRYLPVVVNSDFDNLKQSFTVALRSALLSRKLDNLVPKSTFDDCLRILDYWMNDQVIATGRLAECKNGRDLGALRQSLAAQSVAGYEDFVSLYNCVSIGQHFNPLVNEDVAKVYSEVANEVKKFGYTGIFVVFDEFSKFLESKSKHLSDDLKFIQDFAEMANRSDENYSVNLCCIAHKPITQYGTNSSRTLDLLKTVDGRFVPLRFHRGMKENTELISNAIQKKPAFSRYFDGLFEKEAWLFDSSKNLGLLDPEDDFLAFAKGVYPLTPVAACLLIRISELVAQNERTIFTFISGKDANCLPFLCAKTEKTFIGADSVFDYFKDQISQSDDQAIKNAHYLAEGALRDQRVPLGEQIIKVIALIKVVNDPGLFKATNEMISLALGLGPASVEAATSALVKAGIIRENFFDGSFDFSLVGSKEINNKAENLLAKELRHVDPIEYLNRLEKDDFYLPNAYNVEKRITRYCRYVYLNYSAFVELSDFSTLRQDCDIVLLRLIGEEIDAAKVKAVVKRAKCNRVIVEIGKEINGDNLSRLLRYYAAYLKMTTTAGGGNAYNAVSVVISESESEIHQLIQDAFSEENVTIFSNLPVKSAKPSHQINEIFSQVYSATPLINNEMLNRNNVTPQYLKARNDVVDYILSGKKFDGEWTENHSETSPEETIRKIFVDRISNPAFGIGVIIDQIYRKFSESKSPRVEVRELVKDFTNSPYGIRIGVLPLFVAEAIAKLNRLNDSTVTLFYHDKEVELDSIALGKALQGVTEDYCFQIDGDAKERGNYLSSIIRFFNGQPQPTASANLTTALSMLKNMVRNLPQITRTASKTEYIVSVNDVDEKFLREFSQFDLNPSEVLFDFLPTLFHATTLDQTLTDLKKEVAKLNDLSDQISKNEFWELHNQLGFQGGHLLNYLKDFLAQNHYKVGTLIGNKAYCALADYLTTSTLFDDGSLIRKISHYVVGVYFEDWVPGMKKTFIEGMVKWKEFILASFSPEARSVQDEVSQVVSATSTPNNISPLAGILENSIRTSIASFGSSVSEADIVYALAKVIKDIKGEDK